MKYCAECHRTYPHEYNICPADQTALQASHEFHAGMIIRNKYEVLNLIGVGGMGLVYRSRHVTFNELCAIKVINDDIAGDPNFLRRFQTEATVTRKLRHPNAVRVEDFDYTDEGRPFIVMELVEGKSLSQVLKEEGPLSVARAVRIATQVARVIGVAHKLGIVHRDIKPCNIILTADEHSVEMVKVLDFGIAKLREAAGDAVPEMTMTGMMIGTPFYMSPEQFLGKKAGERIDGRSDIYSLGVVLYQMITARLPFEGDTLYSVMQHHLQDAVQSPDELKPELQIPKSLSQVILKTMEKSPSKRFQTAEDLVVALDRVSKEQVVNVLPAHSAEAKDSPLVTKSEEPEIIAKGSGSSSSGPQAITARSFAGRPSFRLYGLIGLLTLALGAVLATGMAYVKYQSVRRGRILSAIDAKFKSAPSLTLRETDIRVSVSATCEVTLNGAVRSNEDSAGAELIAASVPGVMHVTNRLTVTPAESSDSLISKGIIFMDSGNYQSAIDCFRRSSIAPDASQKANEWLDRAQRAEQTEEELLRTRR